MGTKSKTHKDIVKGWYPYSEEEINKYVSARFWRNLTTFELD